MTMKLGKPVPGVNPGRRDAFHVPAVLVTCEETLPPGTSVRFTDLHYQKVYKCKPSETRHGMVDPWLTEAPRAGTPFWTVLEIGVAQDLTHNFALLLDGVLAPQNLVVSEGGFQEEEFRDEDDNDQCSNC